LITSTLLGKLLKMYAQGEQGQEKHNPRDAAQGDDVEDVSNLKK
jgi:hypothetical protein